MATNPRAGIARVYIDGTPYDLVGDLNYTLNNYKKEMLTGMDTVHGYKETVVACKIEFTIRDAADLSVIAFQGMTADNITAVVANGKTIQGSFMVCTDVQTVDAAEATIRLTFEGSNLVELGVA